MIQPKSTYSIIERLGLNRVNGFKQARRSEVYKYVHTENGFVIVTKRLLRLQPTSEFS